jgi:hypothetical protein
MVRLAIKQQLVIVAFLHDTALVLGLITAIIVESGMGGEAEATVSFDGWWSGTNVLLAKAIRM